MRSIGELILQGHFSRLKDDINQAVADESQPGFLKQLLQYLKKLENKGLLDTEGSKLAGQLACFLNEEPQKDVMPNKLPMEKAGKKSKGNNRKAG